MTNQYVPQLRVEKTTRNRDDLRVMIAGSVFCILMIMVQGAYTKFHDAFIAERPFVSATVQLIYVDEGLPPMVLYDADANQPVAGTWTASIYTENDVRLNSRKGNGNYNDNEDESKLWSWSGWFDNEQSDPPPIPAEPFYVCVRYDVAANDSGVDDSTEKFCSEPFYPGEPTRNIHIDTLVNKEMVE
jgi:hypothetical protein